MKLKPELRDRMGARPPRAWFSEPSRKTPRARKVFKGSCQFRTPPAVREARTATFKAGVLPNSGAWVNPTIIPFPQACRVKAQRRRAFSLLEVMIAIGIFFLAVFAILALVSNSLANARRLHRPQVDASAVLAQYASTNILIEGTYSGELSELLGKEYQNYNWTAEIREVESNHLYQVECIVQPYGKREIISDLSTLLYRPQSPPGSLDGGNFIR